jgi:DNA-binding MarR family transcriptional regulator
MIKHTQIDREQHIQEILATMSTMKRSMVNHLQAVSQNTAIPYAQLELLATIKHTQPISFKNLAQQLCVSPGAVSQMAESLESAKLIQRETDPNDRRIVHLSITKKGDRLLGDLTKQRQRAMKSAMEILSNEELEIWARVQQKLLQYFQAESTTKDA